MRYPSTRPILKALPANSRLFSLFRGRSRRFFRSLLPRLEYLEAQEIAHFALRFAGQLLKLPDELPGLLRVNLFRLAEELAHLQVEDLENLEERVETDLVLSLLHPGEIGLRDADLVRQLHLREVPPLAELADAGADEVDLPRRVG